MPRPRRIWPESHDRTLRHTARVRRHAFERLRNAVAGCRGLGLRVTFNGMSTLGLILAAKMLERRYNAGARFAACVGAIASGRPKMLNRARQRILSRSAQP